MPVNEGTQPTLTTQEQLIRDAELGKQVDEILGNMFPLWKDDDDIGNDDYLPSKIARKYKHLKDTIIAFRVGGWARHKRTCAMGEYSPILVAPSCTCGLSDLLRSPGNQKSPEMTKDVVALADIEKRKKELENEPLILEIKQVERYKEIEDEINALYHNHLSYYETTILKKSLAKEELSILLEYLYLTGDGDIQASIENILSQLGKCGEDINGKEVFGYIAEKIREKNPKED